MIQQKLQNYFNTHPQAAIVFVALGVLFQDADKAAKYLGGVKGKNVEKFTREQVAAAQKEIDDAAKKKEAEANAPKEEGHILTEEDFENNPELKERAVELGLKVGDTIKIPSADKK